MTSDPAAPFLRPPSSLHLTPGRGAVFRTGRSALSSPSLPPAASTSSRAFVPAFAAALGQSVVIENIGGASSRVRNQAVLRAAADGHTILITNDTLAAVEALPVAGSGPIVSGLAPVLLGVSASHAVVANPLAGLPNAAA